MIYSQDIYVFLTCFHVSYLSYFGIHCFHTHQAYNFLFYASVRYCPQGHSLVIGAFGYCEAGRRKCQGINVPRSSPPPMTGGIGE